MTRHDTDFTHSLAVVIGIDAYGNGIPRLTTAVNDAARLAGLLADAHGYETVLLTEPATGGPVTRECLRTLFMQELPARLGDDDRLLVYFAGHGVALDGDDGPRGYLVPQDARPGDSASMLPMTDLHAWLTALPCRHMLAILDCCFAGAFRWASTRHLGALPDVIYRERYDRYLRSPAWQVLTSAAYDQKALDVLNGKAIGVRESDGKGHSPFAQALIDALEKGEADLVPKGQGDGVITATELYLYLRQQVEVQAEEQASHEQTPDLWPLNKHRKGEFIFLVPGHPLDLPPAPPLTADDKTKPYRGLQSYDQDHRPFFFGREQEIEELTALVSQQPFVAVLGASGTGKSSLVKAGVLPRLQGMGDGGRGLGVGGQGLGNGGQGAGRGYHVLSPMRPTDRPVRALEALLRAELGEDPSGFPNPKGLGDDALAAAITRWAATHPGRRLVLTIDQFEELATLCRDDTEREQFLRLLKAAVKQQSEAFRLIITLRTDFEPQFTQEGSPLAAVWKAGRTVVPPMDIEDLRQVIEGPASVRVLYFDPPELVDDLIKEVIQTPGALPLLSFTLSELYVKYVQSGRDDRALSGADYNALGGVVGSLRNRATEEYDRLPDDAHRLTMQRVMLRMVAVEGGELARRRVALSELEYPTTEENARVQTVLDRLVAARLLVRGTSDPSPGSGQALDGTQGEAYVEPAHDALVLAWDKLLRWKQEAEEYLPLQRRLAQAASEWRKAAPEARLGLLWDGDPRLPQLEETLWPTDGKQNGLAGRFRLGRRMLMPKTDAPVDAKWLNQTELAFTQTSVRARARFWQRTIGLGLIVLLVTGTLLAFGFNQQQQSAASDRVAATEQALRATSDANATVAVANEGAAKVAEATAVFEASARGTAQAQEAQARATAELARATAVAAQAETERLKRGIEADQLTANALNVLVESPSLALLLAVEGMRVQNDHIVTSSIPHEQDSPFSSTTSLEPVVTSARRNVYELLAQVGGQPLTDAGDATEALEWSRDGRSLISSGALPDAGVRVWDGANPAMKPLNFQGAVRPMALSPDGRWLATDSFAFRMYLWDMANPFAEPIRLNTGSKINSLTFSADGRWLAAGVDANMALLWRMSDLAAKPFGFQHDRNVQLVALSPNSRWLATAEEMGPVRLWSLAGDISTPITLTDNSVAATDLIFSANNQWLIVVSAREVRLWPVSVESADSISLPNATAPVDITSDGLHLATSSVGNAAMLWDLLDPRADPVILPGGQGPIRALAFNLDGGRLAAGSEDHLIRVWDTTQITATLLLQGHEDSVRAVTFSPNADRLASSSQDQTLRVWNLPDYGASSVVLRGHTQDLTALVFSADGRWLSTGAKDNTVRLWNLADPTATATVLQGHISKITALVFSADSRSLAAAAENGDVRIWRVTEPDLFPAIIRGRGEKTSVLALSSDGRWLSAASEDGKVWLSDSDASDKSFQLLIDAKSRIHALAFSPDSHWLAAGSNDKRALLWNLGEPTVTPVVLTGHEERVSAVAFSTDNALLASGSWDSTIRVWALTDLSKGPTVLSAPIFDVGTNQLVFGIYAMAFDPDMRWLASTTLTGAGYLWSLAGGATEGYPLNQAEGPLAFSGDGQWLATGSVGGNVQLWDLTDHAALPIVLSGHAAPIKALAFSPDGRWLATGSDDTTVRLWPLRISELIDIACRTAGRNLSEEEWSRYMHGSTFRSTCLQRP